MDESIFSQLPPDALAQLMELGVLDEEGGMLEQQLQQAQALRQPMGQPHSTMWGAALGGMGDLIRAARGAEDEKRIRAEQKELLGKKTSGRSVLADLLRGRPQMAAPASPVLQPMDPNRQFSPFGF